MEHELISRVRHEGSPLLDTARSQATFVWKGRAQPVLMGDFNEWCAIDIATDVATDAAGSREPVYPGEVENGVWAATLTLPSDAYIEYSFVVNGKPMPDPFNPSRCPNGMGEENNFFYMSGAAPTPLTKRKHDVPHGVLTRYIIEAGDVVVSGRRTVYLYQPPVREPCPLLVVLDGPEYLRRCKLPLIVDNLIAEGRIRPIALALVDNSATARFIEYACSDATVSFLTDHVMSFARERLNLLDHRRAPGRSGPHGIMGASMGGPMALYAAYRAPEVFGHVLSQSGAFNVLNRDLVVFDLLRQCSPKPLRVWMDVGRYESLLDCNRRMNEVLAARGYDVTYREYSGGHNYPSWRNDVWRGLEVLFGANR